MKKEDLRFGQMVYINSLQHTKYSIGVNANMEIFPGTFMILFVLAWNLFGDAIRDAFDPKLRRK